MDKFVLIDGNSLFNRAYYATPVFTTSDGMPTNAIFGFTKLLFKILDDVKPQYIAVAFDMKAPTFRHNMYDGYKATRKPMPDDLAVQVEPLKDLLKAMKIAICQKEGIEADDIVGTLSNKFDLHSYIYTGDRDSYQLVDEKTDVHYTKKGVSDLLKLNCDNFYELIGIKPEQIIDLKALMGDKSDNIPGVAGIGEKSAQDLLTKYGTLKGIYDNLENIKGALAAKLESGREMAELSYKLATIDRNCDLDLKIEDCIAPEKFGAEVKNLFKKFEFNSFLGLNIFDDGVAVPRDDIKYPEKIFCKDYAQIEPFLKKNEEFAVVLEENSAEIYVGGVQFTVSCVSESLLAENGLTFGEFIQVLREIYSVRKHHVINFSCKKAAHILSSYGIEYNCRFDDLSIVKYLCDFNVAGLNLKELCEYNFYNFEYSAFAVAELYKKYYQKLVDENMQALYEEIEKPLMLVLADMEEEGVKISLDRLDELSIRFLGLIGDYKEKIYEACGKQFNVNSPVQLGEVLYNLGLTEVKKKKTGKYSTNAEVLEKLIDKHPIVDYVLKYRLYQKLHSTYIEGFRPLVNKKTGVVHTTYNQTLTTTGRLSSANPNLQNIPVREDEGRELRKVFVPREGNVFIDADYSQIELRLLAHFSGCKELVEAYNNGIDVHATTAAQVFGVPLNEVTPKMRREAKAVNFGIIYGISDFGLSKNLNISVQTAKQYIDRYFETYSAVKDYMNANVEFAKENGYVSTLTGRKRVIPEIKSANYNLRQFGERAAMNMPLQGSSADIIKIAMINVHKALKEKNLKTKLILQVHDELILEAPEEEKEIASEILKYEMENAVKLSVPLTVEVHSGRSWYDAK